MTLLSSTGASSRKLGIAQRLANFWLNHLRQAISSLGEMWRTRMASVMTIAVLGLSMTLPATFYVLVKNTQAVADNWQNSSEITIFIRKNTTAQQIQQFITRINLYPEVAETQYINPQQGLEDFQTLSGFGDALQYLDANPLPPVVIVMPTSKFRTADGAKQLLSKLEDEREVAMAKLDIEWLERLDAIISLIKDVVIAIAALLFLSVVLIVGNTIRLAILNRRTEIEVMKLVGATDAFIQRPFLYTGIWYGVFGGVIAWASITIMIVWLEASIAQIAELYQRQISLEGLSFGDFLMITLLAVALGWLGSYISVKRHISDIEPD